MKCAITFLNVFLTIVIYLFIYFENMASEKCAAEKTCGGVRLREELMDVSKCGHCMCF